MGLRCYIDSWVYCTNNPSLTYLWLRLRHGKLREDVKTVGPYRTRFSTVNPQTVSLLQPPELRVAQCGFLYFTFCTKQTLTWNLQSFFWLSVWNSKTCFLQCGELLLQLGSICRLEWYAYRLLSAPELGPNSAQTHKATCTISLVFSAVRTLLPAKKVVLSVDSWVTKGLEHS